MEAFAELVHNPSTPLGWDIAGFGVSAVVIALVVAVIIIVIRRVVRGRDRRDG